MILSCVWEHNGDDTLLYCADLPGVCARGNSLAEARQKLPVEALRFSRWTGSPLPGPLQIDITYEKSSDLDIRDADSDVLFPQERAPLTLPEYERLKAMVLKSAQDFHFLYASLPDKHISALIPRKTFYGSVPVTGEEMYQHTKNVNAYYFAEIQVDADNEGTIFACRERGFALLEQQPDFLENAVFDGSYGEQWTLRKVLRRFLWHDRIHAKAMHRMAVKTFGSGCIPDPFSFEA